MIFKRFLMFVVLLAALAAHAQTAFNGMTIPTQHPILWFGGPGTRLNNARAYFNLHGMNAPAGAGSNSYMRMALYDVLSNTCTYTNTVYNWAIGFNIDPPTPLARGGSCDKCRFQGEKITVVLDYENACLSAAQRTALLVQTDKWMSAWDGHVWGGRKVPDNGLPTTSSPMGNYFMGHERNDFEFGLAAFNETNVAWQASHTYTAGDLVTDSNNNLEQVFIGGQSAGSAPTWAAYHNPVINIKLSGNQAGNGIYNCTSSNCAGLANIVFTFSGFTTAANNGKFLVTSSDATHLTTTNTATTGETKATIASENGPITTDNAVTWMNVGRSPKYLLDVATDSTSGRYKYWFVPCTQPGQFCSGGPVEGSEYNRTLPFYSTTWLQTASVLGRDIAAESPYWKEHVLWTIYATSNGKITRSYGTNNLSKILWEQPSYSDDARFPEGGTMACDPGRDGNGNAISPTTGCSVGGGSTTYQDGVSSGVGGYFSDYMNWAANYYASNHIGRYAKTWIDMTNVPVPYHMQMLDASGSVAGLPFSNLNSLDYFEEGNQHLYGRTSWTPANSLGYHFVMGDAGYNSFNQLTIASHRHRDLGDIDLHSCGPVPGGGGDPECRWLTHNSAAYGFPLVLYGDPQVWLPSHAYNVNDRIVPRMLNGYAYQQMNASGCTSGPTDPALSTNAKYTVPDNDCLWENTSDTSDSDNALAASLTLQNSVLVNGQGMPPGTNNGQPQQASKILRMESEPEWMYAVQDMTAAYRNNCTTGTCTSPSYVEPVSSTVEADNIAVNHIEREALVLKPLRTTLVFDRVALNPVVFSGGTLPATSVTTSALWHSETQPVIEDATHERFDNGSQTLHITTLLPASPVQRVVTEWLCPTTHVTATIQSFSVTGTTMTIVASSVVHPNNLTNGTLLLIGGMTGVTTFNTKKITVTSFTGGNTIVGTFTTTFNHADYASTADTGTLMTIPGCDSNKNDIRIAGQYRLELEGKGCAQMYQLNVLQARNSTDPNITATVSDSNSGCGTATTGTFTVTLHPSVGPDWTVKFAKGQTSCPLVLGVPSCLAQYVNDGSGSGDVALATGKASVSYTDDGPVWSGAINLAPLVSISISPVTPTTDTATPVQMACDAVYSDGSHKDCTNAAVWTSGTPATATIDSASGLVTPVAQGTTLIGASFTDGVTKSDSTVLTVGTPAGGGGGNGTNPGSTSISGDVSLTGNVRVPAQ